MHIFFRYEILNFKIASQFVKLFKYPVFFRIIMEREKAQLLVDEIEKHPYIISPDRKMFIDVLASVDVSESARFYEKLPYESQELAESDRFYYLSLRRILRNRNILNRYNTGICKQILDEISFKERIYSSSILTRRIRQDKDLINIIEACPSDFSLLAKFQIYDLSNEDNAKITIRPILIVPYAKEEETNKILSWEEKNIIYS